jgi:hypothetical protein
VCVPLRGGLEAWTHLLLHGVVGALLVGLLQQLVQILHRPRRLLSRRRGIQQARRDLGAAARRKVGSSLCVRALGKWEGVALMDVAGTRRERRTRTPNPPGAGADAPALSDAADCRLPIVDKTSQVKSSPLHGFMFTASRSTTRGQEHTKLQYGHTSTN